MKIINGDLVKATKKGDVDVMLHICNCQGVMGSGIAKQVKNTFPEAFKEYTRELEFYDTPLGTISYTENVVNLLAQCYYGTTKRHLNYGALGRCLEEAATYANDNCFEDGISLEEYTIGIPYLMGCDRAGGSWEVVLEMIEYYLADFNVVIYKLK